MNFVKRMASFRLEPRDLAGLDRIVDYMRAKDLHLGWGPPVNRTTVLQLLIADYVVQIIKEEEAKLAKDLLQGVKKKVKQKKPTKRKVSA
jgi:hypothetical protein